MATTGTGKARSAEESAAFHNKIEEDSKKMKAKGPTVLNMQGFKDFMAKPVTLPAFYKKKDLLIYAVGIGAIEDRHVYELNPDFEMFPTFPASLLRKGDSDNVHFQKEQPVVRAAGLPYRGLGAPPTTLVLDAERYIECVKPMPIEGGFFDFKYETTYLTRKKDGNVMLNEYRTDMVDQKTGELYYRIFSSAFAIMGAPVAPFDNLGTSAFSEVKMPDRPPDHVETYQLYPIQGLLSRLSGDFGPPNKNARVGYPQGMNGLHTLGMNARMVLKAYGGCQQKAFRTIRLRFTKPVNSGETLECRMWLPRDDKEKLEGGGQGASGTPTGPPPAGVRRVLFSTICKESGDATHENGYVDIYEEFFTTATATQGAGAPSIVWPKEEMERYKIAYKAKL